MKTFQIIPDYAIDNKNLEKFIESLHLLYEPLIKRIFPTIVYEILLTKKSITFYLSIPDNWVNYVKTQSEICWPNASIKENDYTLLINDQKNIIATELNLVHHYFLSLSTDRRTLDPLPSLFEVIKLMSATDYALIQIILEPESSDWQFAASEAYEKFKEGNLPQRISLSPERVINAVAKTGAYIGYEIMNTVHEFITEQDAPPLKIDAKHINISNATLNKANGSAFNTTIRLLIQSESPESRKAINMSIIAAYKTLNLDNEICAKNVKKVENFIEKVKNRSIFPFKLHQNILNTAELVKFMQLPLLSLQQEYPIEAISVRELEVPESLLRGSMEIGTITKKGMTSTVYWSTESYDELCLPRVVIGGMGTGKTLGSGAGFAADAIRKGYSVFAIDVSDGDLADTIRDSLPKSFPEGKIVDLNFGNTQYPIPLSWNEITRNLNNQNAIANIMTNQLVGYLSKFSEEAGDRTERYIKAAGKAVFSTLPNATLLEIFLMLTSKLFRESIVDKIQDIRLKDLWTDFDEMSDGLKNQIVGPVLNRLDNLIGNELIANCIFQIQNGKIDFRKWADEGYCVILRVPKSILWETATDSIVTFLIAKLWLAILTRMDQPINQRKPCFLILDEPHQFLGSARGGIRSTWGSMLTESRKWRLGILLLFHDWVQIPKELCSILKSSNPHYILYSSSKGTFNDLKEEIEPFTVEEALKLPTHQALCLIRHDNRYYKFICKMAAPPIHKHKSWRHEYIDRIKITDECSLIYGRNVEEVEENIYQREHKYLR